MLFGRGIFGKSMAATAALVAAVQAAPALADTAPITAYYRDPALGNYYYPGPAEAKIYVNVTASVGGSCGFVPGSEPNATFNVGAIDTTAWTRDVPFTVNCTAPWRIAVSSLNGALKTAGTAPTGYQVKAPYTVALTLPWNNGSTSGTLTPSCPVAQLDQALGTSPCALKGTASTTVGQQVPRSVGLAGSKVTVSAPAYPGPDILVAGTYSDTLIVTVSPSS